MTNEVWHWVGFNIFVLIMLLLDLGVFHKKDTAVKIKSALLWSGFWIFLALLFNVFIYFDLGKEKALDFFTGYLLEKSLSIDNLFVFILIFKFFKIDSKYQHKVLFWGIFGALIMRAIFIFAGVAIIQKFEWVMYIFGVFLIYTGMKMFFEKKETEEFNPNKNIVLQVFKKLMPVTHDRTCGTFFLRVEGKLHATPFFLALLFIEASDLIFAVDSIPAILSVTTDTYIVYTSNIFAILGLRSLYFALNGIMDYFHYLKYALAGILTFIGLKMCFNELAHTFGFEQWAISNFVSLGVIIGLISISIIASLATNKKKM